MLPEKSTDISPPPIASPHGGASTDRSSHSLADELGPHVLVRCTVKSALRYGCVELFQPLGVIIILFLAFILGALPPLLYSRLLGLLLAFLFFCAVVDYLCARQYIVELRPDGVYRRRTFGRMLLRWRQFLWIADVGGNIWMATFGTGCFIPRESFGSREEARKFAQMVRELRRTRGASWPSSGVSPDSRAQISE